MKLLLIGLILLSGCASVSDYNQGCRDGVYTFIEEHGAFIDKDLLYPGCDALDKIHNSKEETQHTQVQEKATP